MRRDPEEEYFMLAVLANKMIHTDEHDNPEYVYEINAKKLFAQVKTLKVPFHRWYKWLETRFMQLQEVHVKELQLKNEEIRKWQVEQEKQRKQAMEKSKK